ncbi:MAG: pilus assembly protein [Acidimicrobiia bacterium]|nr:pilus assembly protein [Acidimicrobiia bacterium]
MKITRRSQAGSALLEFALGFAILVPVLVGAVQLTVAALQIQQLSAAVHRAARQASESDWDGDGAQLRTEAQNLVLYGTRQEATMPLFAGLRREHVMVETQTVSGAPRRISIWIENLELDLPAGKQTLRGKPKATFPFRGLYSSR